MNFKKSGILSTVGQTPLVKLDRIYNHLPLDFYAKLEMFNPGGSIKDRPALKMVLQALENGELERGGTVIESSSGNMGIGLAQVCRYYKLKLIVVVDPKINSHTLKILQTYGVHIEEVTQSDDDGNYLAARLQRVRELVDKNPDIYWPNQYTNEANPAAHEQTMAEIAEGMPGPPDYLFATTSTCGTIMGCANYVQQYHLDTKIVAVDAVGSVIFGSPSADRLVPGHGAGRPSDLLDRQLVDHVVHINDEECIAGCHRLLDQEAILAGGSSGGVIAAVQKMQSKIPDGSTCAVILPDSGERYLDTVYIDGWLDTHFGEVRRFKSLNNGTAQNYARHSILSSTMVDKSAENGLQNKNMRKIAIVGGGPKGMYGFERLAAQFNAHPVDCEIEIHVYNKSSHFGSGDIYRPGQPSYLLINNPIGDINMWIDEQPAPVASELFSLTSWLQKNRGLEMTENDYVSRALVGEYLEKGFEMIAARLPEGVSGTYYVGEITDIQKEEEQYGLKVSAFGEEFKNIPHRYDHILLATGHPKNKVTEQEKEYQQFADQHESVDYVPFIYPVNPTLNEITPQSRVGVKGIGLTFVDAVLALTEGRGGCFARRSEDGKLLYQPSGQEPEVIYPFSRSGLPMVPRGPAPKNEVPLKFFTETALVQLKSESPGGKLDFKNQMLPLLYQELMYAFYSIQMQQAGFEVDLQSCATFTEVQHHINTFHKQHPDAERFEPDLFLKPLKSNHFKNDDSFNENVKRYLKFFVAEARKGALKSPWAAVSTVWRKATPVFGSFYEFGGLKPASQHYFDMQFRRLLNRVTFGPPVESVEKILALMNTGRLDFSVAKNPTVETNRINSTFMLNSSVTAASQSVEFLVNARIPKVSIKDEQSPLYRNLLRRGLIKPFRNEHGGYAYQPGCAAISREGFAIDEEGNVNRSIALTGTPTEGITFDNDALSRTRNNFVSNWAAFIRKSYALSAANHHIS